MSRTSILGLALVAACAIAACGKEDITEPTPVQTDFKTFITTAGFTGDILAAGGMGTAVASADALCMADAGKPAGGGTYKAMLVDGVNRVACTTTMCGGGAAEHVDWVFKKNAKYYESDGTSLIFTADGSGIADLSNLEAETFAEGARDYWTGLKGNDAVFSGDPWNTVPNSNLCGGAWANTDAIGAFGSSRFGGWGAIGGGAARCDDPRRLVCVEQ